ncbi:hypothetical protein [Polyangium jinanense]|uniref:Uncharacterized protein n=1 Tax=Polyangium jinanense TaxID=2829994 RepID=A0A9X3XED0_9BACT|nr:hypothetical protein [Polyangium jinanense]MDC3956845.1 hypothetical protein [Polyangium jinanense]MDC3957684.1 hypothetical protein [Polyangium jinanense]MDC3987108.1 hypothetical protein [Polyangium jinanense]
MSTSHLESPRKILDLGAGTTASAWLGTTGLVAFLTSRPARIAVTPVTATSGDAIDLPRITAQEVALLSKDVALVRDKEGTVWSVPLGDPYRVREIVRDMRTLLPRPSGEGALAISDEGRVLSLSLGRGEVGARPVEVPGRVRAGDAGDGVTYLLAEGEQGGQLRVYPGTAPERGPSARVTLPAGAAEFDQVRGGRVYCVVWKRGGAGICVVTRDGERAEASLVTLEAPIADAVVTDTSVVVAFANGKIALYDAASLSAPSEGPKAPVSTTAAGGKGRPRVLLATTTKGATSIWIGTAEGEVMRAAVVEVAAAPEPPVAELAAPVVQGPSKEEVEALRKEVEALRGALDARVGELASVRGELSERVGELASVKRELDARVGELASVRGELDARVGELASVRGELDARVGELASVRGELDARVGELASVRGELSERVGELASVRGELDARVGEVASVKRELGERVDELASVKRELEVSRGDLARSLEDLREERAKLERSLGKRIDGVLPDRVRSGLDFVVSLVENRRR